MRKACIFVSVVFFLPLTLKAYEPTSTHAGLTQEIVSFYNEHADRKLTEQEGELIIRGSIEEDIPSTRALNHFYDPIRNIGINDGRTAKDWALDKTVVGNDFSWHKALEYYAQGDEEKAFLALGHIIHLLEDMSVPDHTRNDPHIGVGLAGLFTGESPFESWTSEHKDRETLLGLGLRLVREGEQPRLFGELGKYFDFLANYSNQNFFSQDTIDGVEYIFPKVVSYDDRYGYSIDSLSGEEVPIVLITKEKNGIKKYIYSEDDFFLIQHYFDRLSKQAILSGAGAISLFFREAEEARERYEAERARQGEQEVAEAVLLNERLSKKGIVGLTLSGLGFLVEDVSQPVRDVARSTTHKFVRGVKSLGEDTAVLAHIGTFSAPVVANVVGEAIDKRVEEGVNAVARAITFVQEGLHPQTSGSVEAEFVSSADTVTVQSVATQQPVDTTVVAQPLVDTTATAPTPLIPQATQPSGPPTQPLFLPISPGFGGGGTGVGVTPSAVVSGDVTPPDPPVIVSPQASSIVGGSSVAFTGTAEAGSTVRFENPSGLVVADSSGNWTLSLPFTGGSHTVSVTAQDSSGNVSTATTRSFSVDTTPPILTFAVADCDTASLASASCLLLSGTTSLSWHSSDDDLSYFVLNLDGVVSTTTATTTTLSLSSGSTHTLAVAAVDARGNTSATSTEEVEVWEHPIIINEVAWAGTSASAFDEWIELYNQTTATIDLSSVVLRSGTAPYMQLSGTISPGEYFLIERKNSGESNEATESSVTDVTADLWMSFGTGLSNSGEALVLEWVTGGATTTLDQVATCGGGWCGGSSASKATLERYSPTLLGSDTMSWGTALSSFIRNGTDATGSTIYGTPGRRNSLAYLVSRSASVTTDTTLRAANSPYFIPYEGLTINAGKTLTIDPGVVIKFIPVQSAGTKGIVANGVIIANGTAEQPIIFTSIHDDVAGGDTNTNGGATTPASGDWRQVQVNASGSSFTHTIFRYGGNTSSSPSGMVAVQNATVSFDASTFSHAPAGLYLTNSSGTISNTAFSNHTFYGSSVALYVRGGSPRLEGNTFTTNAYAVRVFDAPDAEIISNTFSSNTVFPVYVEGNAPLLRQNTGSGNTWNGIALSGSVALSNGTTTLSQNTLPYLLYGIVQVVSNATLAFEDGVVLKGYDGNASEIGKLAVRSGGFLYHNGATAESVIFTSPYDDTVSIEAKDSPRIPNGGDWHGLDIDEGGRAWLEGFTLRYAGSNSTYNLGVRGALQFSSGATGSTIRNGTIEKNATAGVLFAGSGDATFQNLTVRDHNTTHRSNYGFSFGTASGTLDNIAFSSNTTDIYATSGNGGVFCTNCGSPSTNPVGLLAH